LGTRQLIATLDESALIQSSYNETSKRSFTYLEATKDNLILMNFGLVGDSSSGFQKMIVSQNSSANAGIALHSKEVTKKIPPLKIQLQYKKIITLIIYYVY
jgi:hypothetical protein